MKTPRRSLASRIGRRILPYIYIALGVGVLVFMAVEIAPTIAGFLVGYGAAIQIIAVVLPALAIGVGIALGGERSTRMEKISNLVYYPSLLVFVQVMFSTGRMPGIRGRNGIELPWYTQLDDAGQRSCQIRGIAGWGVLTVVVVFMVVAKFRSKQNPES